MIQITFEDRRLVANAGLILPATLALHAGWVCPNWLTGTWTWAMRRARGANPGDKISTLVPTNQALLAGGRRHVHRRRRRVAHRHLDGLHSRLAAVVKAPSTLGTFLAQLQVVAMKPSVGPE